MYRIQLITIAINLVLLAVIFHFIRNEKLKIRYAFLWLLTCLSMFVVSFWRSLINMLGLWLGVYYPPSLLFMFAYLFLLVIVFHFSVVISGLAEDRRRLTQEVALLSERVETLEKKAALGG